MEEVYRSRKSPHRHPGPRHLRPDLSSALIRLRPSFSATRGKKLGDTSTILNVVPKLPPSPVSPHRDLQSPWVEASPAPPRTLPLCYFGHFVVSTLPRSMWSTPLGLHRLASGLQLPLLWFSPTMHRRRPRSEPTPTLCPPQLSLLSSLELEYRVFDRVVRAALPVQT